MRRFIAWAVIVIGNLLVFGLMLALSSQEPALYFKETFDDPTLLSWEHTPGARVVNQVLRIEPGNATFYPKSLGNFSLTIRARRLGNGTLSITYCAGDQGSYVFQFGDASIVLIREQAAREEEIAAAPISIPAATWVTIHIIHTEGNHVINLDGKQALIAYDPHPLPPGGLFLASIKKQEAVGEFDDLEVRWDEHAH